MKKRGNSIKSKFTALENNFLNTFFSGLYISANEFIAIGKKVGLTMGMNSRELLIKELLNKADEEGKLEQVVTLLNTLISERVNQYHSLSMDYPSCAGMLSGLAHKANATKSLLASQTQRNPYEH